MSTIAFDTHEVELLAGGVEARQAKAIVSAFKRTQESAELASKADIEIEIAELKTDLLKWAFAMLAGQTALILTISPKLIH